MLSALSEIDDASNSKTEKIILVCDHCQGKVKVSPTATKFTCAICFKINDKLEDNFEILEEKPEIKEKVENQLKKKEKKKSKKKAKKRKRIKKFFKKFFKLDKNSDKKVKIYKNQKNDKNKNP